MEDKKKFSDFKARFITTVVLLPVIIWIIIGGGVAYFILLIIGAYLAGREWSNICGGWSFSFDGMCLITFICLAITSFYMNNLIIGFVFLAIGMYTTYFSAKIRAKSEKKLQVVPNYLNRPLFLAIGVIYIGLSFSSLAYFRNLDSLNLNVLWIFGLVVCSDVSAYIFGNIIGGKKLAPKISPGKTWSGFIFAIIITFVFSYIVAGIINLKNILDISLFGAFIVIVAHIGDLLESALKRYLKIKDTGNLIPGHGGILDRIDALCLVSIVTFFISLVTNKSILLI